MSIVITEFSHNMDLWWTYTCLIFYIMVYVINHFKTSHKRYLGSVKFLVINWFEDLAYGLLLLYLLSVMINDLTFRKTFFVRNRGKGRVV